jgi:two-component system, NarL family, sensor kinase
MRTSSAVMRFMLGSLLAIAVVVVGGFFALRSVTVREAERDTRSRVELQGALVEESGLDDGILDGDPEALARLDDVVAARLLSPSVVRVKLWSRDGRILYSDEPAIIGKRFGLGDEEAELFTRGGADAELSDLSKPENAYERQEGRLLEAHTVIRTPNGTPVLFETYQRFDSVNASGSRLLGALAPTLLAALLVLLLFQVPLSWSLARRLQRGHREREALLERAIESSDAERRRIAADLHDGVVQDVAGVAFGLAPLADAADRRGDTAEAGALRESTERLRHGVRALRTLLVEIHPPSLESAGLEPALHDLLSPLAADGVATTLDVDDGAAAGSAADALVYRVAREALRNVRAHADASSVRVAVARNGTGVMRLQVADDGRGFDAARRTARAEEGHVGLTLLEDLVAQAGGTLAVASVPGEGTTVTLEVPAA